MLIPFDQLITKYDPTIYGILHVGAHHAEEADAYDSAGVPKTVWIEADDHSYLYLRDVVLKGRPRHKVIKACVDEFAHVGKFHIANNGQSSSILELGTHLQHHPEVKYVDELDVQTTTLDLLLHSEQWSSLNFWNLDVQGAELRVLRGAKRALSACDYLYTEVNAEEVYEGGALIQDLDSHLVDFTRVETAWTPHKWGDAFYVRNSLL